MHMKMGVVLFRRSVRGRTEVAISYAHTQSDHGSQAGKDLLIFFGGNEALGGDLILNEVLRTFKNFC